MTKEYVLLVFGMGLVSFLPRWLPLFFLSRRKLPKIVEEWLELIPVAILSALLVPYLITLKAAEGNLRVLSFTEPELFVALPTFVVAFLTKSLAATLVAGMGLFWLAGKLGMG